VTLDLADVIAAEREERWLDGLSKPALAVYHELVSTRDRHGYVAADAARAAVRAALEEHFVALDLQIERVAGRVAVGGAIQPAVEAAARIAARQARGAWRVLKELDDHGCIRVGIEPGSAWRVWTADEAEEAEEVFG
jgi:hypothetical protein